jgi:hypothetical protein
MVQLSMKIKKQKENYGGREFLKTKIDENMKIIRKALIKQKKTF